ncbi:MAG TPA: efflux RND transporter periplasmic adaptor subunit [Steroidobacteraceae bacterium]|jgi:membrane fusion protein (multidrug efflux system)|nr:efflux RND transporter periplasmic adaptor subunit [Steroidobacteraceae bacterium]
MRFFWCTPVIAALLLTACGKQQQAGAPPAPDVGVVTLKMQRVSDVRNLPGRVSAHVIAEVRPQVTGIIQKRLFEEGSEVKAGQPLYQLDDAIYRAEVNSREAAVAKARATLQAAKLAANRSTELARIDAVSAQEQESAVAAASQASADLEAAEAALRSAQVNLAYARISSPISGRIGKSNYTQGALVTANQDQPLTTVQQLDPLYVDLTQSAGELLQLRRDFGGTDLNQSAPVTLILEDGSKYPQQGELKFADLSVDPQTGSFALRAVVPNPHRLLLPGMYVRAVLERGERDAVLAPQRAITRDPKGNGVALVVTADNKVEQRTVSTTRTVGDQWLIDSGLQAGERVIVEGVQKVQPGMQVHPVEATAVAQAPAAAQTAVR